MRKNKNNKDNKNNIVKTLEKTLINKRYKRILLSILIDAIYFMLMIGIIFTTFNLITSNLSNVKELKPLVLELSQMQQNQKINTNIMNEIDTGTSYLYFFIYSSALLLFIATVIQSLIFSTLKIFSEKLLLEQRLTQKLTVNDFRKSFYIKMLLHFSFVLLILLVYFVSNFLFATIFLFSSAIFYLIYHSIINSVIFQNKSIKGTIFLSFQSIFKNKKSLFYLFLIFIPIFIILFSIVSVMLMLSFVAKATFIGMLFTIIMILALMFARLIFKLKLKKIILESFKNK